MLVLLYIVELIEHLCFCNFVVFLSVLIMLRAVCTLQIRRCNPSIWKSLGIWRALESGHPEDCSVQIYGPLWHGHNQFSRPCLRP